MQAGVAAPPGALQWLTPAQLRAITDMLERMEDTLHDWQPLQWQLTDCLQRARRANARAL